MDRTVGHSKTGKSTSDDPSTLFYILVSWLWHEVGVVSQMRAHARSAAGAACRDAKFVISHGGKPRTRLQAGTMHNITVGACWGQLTC
jgi:hypothetical protein